MARLWRWLSWTTVGILIHGWLFWGANPLLPSTWKRARRSWHRVHNTAKYRSGELYR